MCDYMFYMFLFLCRVLYYNMQSALMVDPHPVTEQDQMCIGLAYLRWVMLMETHLFTLQFSPIMLHQH